MPDVKVGTVTLSIWKHATGWRFAYQDANGAWKYITRTDLAKAKEEARKKAREISNGLVDLAALPPTQLSIVRRVLDMGLTHSDLDKWEEANKRAEVSVPAAISEFLKLKRANRGRSLRNTKSLSGDLSNLSNHMGDRLMSAVTVSDLETWLEPYKGRRRKNLRGSAVTFFRWARRRGYIPDKETPAELVETVKITRTIPATWTPAEMRCLLKACPKDYIPWLVLSNFSGLRLEELFTDPNSDKSPLDWSDFHWNRKIIIVRPETDKNGHRRIVPILDVVHDWLYPIHQAKGRVTPKDPPYKVHKKRPSVTGLLGELVGGWRSNANRHSFISYRAAIVGLAQTAMEAGNSETEARKSYNDAKGSDEANIWFSLNPAKIASDSDIIGLTL